MGVPKKKIIKPIEQASGLERALRDKHNAFMTEHRDEIREYVTTRNLALVDGNMDAVAAIDEKFLKLRSAVGEALKWKEAADTMYKARMAGVYLPPKHEYWAYLIDETLEDEDDDKKPMIFVMSGKN